MTFLSSCFLAVKYASAAMKKADARSGKTYGGGSIVLTASVAGIRSGAGPVDCKTILKSYDKCAHYGTDSASKAA